MGKIKHDTFVLTCNCGCGNVLIANQIDDEVYITFCSSDFYSKQSVIYYLKEKFDLLMGKRCVKDIIISKRDLLNFKRFLEGFEYNDEFYKNDSHIVLRYEYDDFYSINLISDMTKKDLLRNKSHRIYDICLHKRDFERLIKRIDKIIN